MGIFARRKLKTDMAKGEPPTALTGEQPAAFSALSRWERDTVYAAYLEGVELSQLPLGLEVMARLDQEWRYLQNLSGADAMDRCLSHFENGEGA